jgi:hypothetical protein
MQTSNLDPYKAFLLSSPQKEGNHPSSLALSRALSLVQTAALVLHRTCDGWPRHRRRQPAVVRPRVRSHCRFRNRGAEYVRESGIKWMRGSTRRQCDRALVRPPRRRPQPRRPRRGQGLIRARLIAVPYRRLLYRGQVQTCHRPRRPKGWWGGGSGANFPVLDVESCGG